MMRANRILLSVVLLVVALTVQVTVLARLHLPGAVPDLVLLTVLGLALVLGHTGGAFVGFGAGLLADLAPPADHAVGSYALVLCVVGYLAGLTKPETGQHRSATLPMLAVAIAAVSSTLLYAAVGALTGDSAVGVGGLTELVFTAALYDLLLAPFVVPLVMALARRTERASASSAEGGPSTLSGSGGSSGWLAPGTSLRTGLRSGLRNRAPRGGRTTRIGSQRGNVLGRSARNRAVRIKGVKRL
jgi:rod shape-determining protein MreD